MPRNMEHEPQPTIPVLILIPIRHLRPSHAHLKQRRTFLRQLLHVELAYLVSKLKKLRWAFVVIYVVVAPVTEIGWWNEVEP